MNRTSAGLLVAGSLAVLGCGHTHLEHNAPGHVDLRDPEPLTAPGVTAMPRDPGEHYLTVSGGVLGALGSSQRLASDARFGGTLGLEGSVLYGRTATSHDHTATLFSPHLPPWSAGLNLGASLAPFPSDTTSLLYAEGQIRQTSTLVSLAAGWAWDPSRSAHGPQLTGALGPLYVRSTYLLDERFELTAGVVLKPWHSWLWSR